jgi:DNA invertase Pin-like site-specific DNA recombinase
VFVPTRIYKQTNDRQLEELSSFCNAKNLVITHTIATVISGRVRFQNRDDVKQLLNLARERAFDTVMVSEISRLGRNASDLRFIIDTLHSYGVNVYFKNLGIYSMENGITSFAVAILIAIYAELTQEEILLLRTRIISGLDAARKRGKRIGRPEGSVPDKELLKKYPQLVRDIKGGLSLRKAEKIHGVCRTTVIKIKRIVAAA